MARERKNLMFRTAQSNLKSLLQTMKQRGEIEPREWLFLRRRVMAAQTQNELVKISREIKGLYGKAHKE